MPARHNILVVDDDERVRRLIARYLTREGYGVREAASGEEMRARIEAMQPDLVILDLMLPDDDGLTLARELRSRAGPDVPIIMVTGKTDTVDKIIGLELGADDYVTKPFDERELLARVRTVLRRAAARAEPETQASTVRFDGWVLDLVAHELLAPDGRHVHLTSNQFQVLACLVTHSNRVLSRGEILELVAGRDWTPMDRSIDVLIGKLRRKVEPDPGNPTLIKTIRGVGYKFTARVESS